MRDGIEKIMLILYLRTRQLDKNEGTGGLDLADDFQP